MGPTCGATSSMTRPRSVLAPVSGIAVATTASIRILNAMPVCVIVVCFVGLLEPAGALPRSRLAASSAVLLYTIARLRNGDTIDVSSNVRDPGIRGTRSAPASKKASPRARRAECAHADHAIL